MHWTASPMSSLVKGGGQMTLGEHYRLSFSVGTLVPFGQQEEEVILSAGANLALIVVSS